MPSAKSIPAPRAPTTALRLSTSLPTTTVLNLINNGAWNIDSAASNLTVAGLTGDATGRFGTTNQTTAGTNLTISGSGTYTFPGVIGAITVAGKTGSNAILSLTMNGTGTQILSGVNTYTGATTVNRGTLSWESPMASISAHLWCSAAASWPPADSTNR